MSNYVKSPGRMDHEKGCFDINADAFRLEQLTPWQAALYHEDDKHHFYPGDASFSSSSCLVPTKSSIEANVEDIWQYFDQSDSERSQQVPMQISNEELANFGKMLGSPMQALDTLDAVHCDVEPSPVSIEGRIPSTSALEVIDVDHYEPLHSINDQEMDGHCPGNGDASSAVTKEKKKKERTPIEDLDKQYMEFWRQFRLLGLNNSQSPEELAEAVCKMDTNFTTPKTVCSLMKTYLSNTKDSDFIKRYLEHRKIITDSLRNVKYYHKRMRRDEHWVATMKYFARQLQCRYAINLDDSVEEIALSTELLRRNILLGKKYTRAIEKYLIDTRGPTEAAKWRRICSS